MASRDLDTLSERWTDAWHRHQPALLGDAVRGEPGQYLCSCGFVRCTTWVEGEPYCDECAGELREAAE